MPGKERPAQLRAKLQVQRGRRRQERARQGETGSPADKNTINSRSLHLRLCQTRWPNGFGRGRMLLICRVLKAFAAS